MEIRVQPICFLQDRYETIPCAYQHDSIRKLMLVIWGREGGASSRGKERPHQYRINAVKCPAHIHCNDRSA